MFPIPIINTYGNTVVPNYDRDNPNKLAGTFTTLGTNSNFTGYGTRMTSYRENLYAVNATSAIYQINPSTNAFTLIATRPVSVRNIGFCCSSTALYCAGGYASTNRFDKYDLTTSTWSTLAVLPAAAYDHAICLDYDKNDFIYYQKYNLFYKYDIANNVWITTGLAALPFNTSTSAEGGWIYSTGYVWYLYGTNFARYNISTNTWETLANFTGSGGRPKISRMGDYIYARQASAGLYQYQISSNTWTTVSTTLPAAASEGALVCSYNHAYAISGSTVYLIN